jgi:hypothetical protein
MEVPGMTSTRLNSLSQRTQVLSPTVILQGVATFALSSLFILSGVQALDPTELGGGNEATEETGFDLIVTSYFTGGLLRLVPETGVFKSFGSYPSDKGGVMRLAYSPDELLYGLQLMGMCRFDPQAGGYLGSVTVPSERRNPIGIGTGLDGALYLASQTTGLVYRKGINEALWEPFGSAVSPNDSLENTAISVSPDGDVFCSLFSKDIVRYNGRTGAFKGVFIPAGNEHLPAGELDLAFGPDGNLYVLGSTAIAVFNGKTGVFLNTFVTGTGFIALTFAPDGDLFVTDRIKEDATGEVLHYDWPSGDLVWWGTPTSPLELRGAYDLVAVPRSRPPSAPMVKLLPAFPTSADDIVCQAIGSIDPEGEVVSYLYDWFLNDIHFDTVTGPSFSHALTTRLDELECIVTPFDGSARGVPASASVMISNASPTIPEVRILPDYPSQFTGMASWLKTPSIDADGDPVLYIFEWYESDDGVAWTRRPELSGNAPPYYDRGEPEISELYTNLLQAGEYWKVDVTPIEVLDKKNLQSGWTGESSPVSSRLLMNRSVRNSQTGSAQVLVLPDLDGDDTAGPSDLILFRSVWHKQKEEVGPPLRQSLFDPEDGNPARIGPAHLFHLLLGWQESIWR